ncbi:MAG: DEAD/DEAH box helicase [Proteobacteria bacterium]|nr:DEAD/DEAH box helicase [Pseudomonadota bacterium]
MTNFKAFGLPNTILNALDNIQITQPTPIQSQAIPTALEGHDILASAQTGSGKTIAYLIPIISKLLNSACGSALILAPTRELADQIKSSLLTLLGKKALHETALLIGGIPIFKQYQALKKNPKYIIGTPGRVVDHLERRSLRLHDTQHFILDETDRMLEMGFSEDIEKITNSLPTSRQTLMFSATMPDNIVKLSQKYLKTPKYITIGKPTSTVETIEQKVLKTTAKEKFSHLLEALQERDGSVIVFVKTKFSAALLAEKLQRHDHQAQAIHGDLKQRQRNAVIQAFRNQKCRILVATDIAARGLDIPHIMHVINYDLPQCPEDYIHRIGRTGRAGMTGHALSFVGPDEQKKWRAIHEHVNHGKTSNTQPQRSAKPKRSSKPGMKHHNNRAHAKHRRPDGEQAKKPFHKQRRNKSSNRSKNENAASQQ